MIACSLTMGIVAMCMAGCRTKKMEQEKQGVFIMNPMYTGGGGGAAFMPKAVVYRTNGDYRNHVAVTLSADGKSLVSFPAPSDIRPETARPIVLADGYLLDRRGISAHAAFLDYTLEEYSKLERTPSAETLMEHIIARRAVVEMYELPMTVSQAAGNPSACNKYVANGFKDCKKIKK